MLYNSHRKELSGGFRRTTNNRMEILAAIAGLEALKEPCNVTLYSDSQYLVHAIEKGWARRWQANGWMRNRKEKAVNPDLWERLLELCKIHTVRFEWLRGHAGHSENERCDELANGRGPGLGSGCRRRLRNGIAIEAPGVFRNCFRCFIHRYPSEFRNRPQRHQCIRRLIAFLRHRPENRAVGLNQKAGKRQASCQLLLLF